MAEKSRSKLLRILLIAGGVLVGLCLICYSVSFIIGQVGKRQAGKISTAMIATLAQSTGPVPNYFALSTAAYETLDVNGPTSTPHPMLTFHPFTPTLTPSPALPVTAGCVPPGERARGRVIQVVSGDTIQVVVGEQTWLVKYIGVHAPGMGIQPEPLGIEATVSNSSLVADQPVILVYDVENFDPTKEYMLGYVMAGNVFVNDEMVRRGLAKAESQPPNTACDEHFSQTEQFAINQRLGLWRDIASSATPLPSPTARRLCDCQGPQLTCEDFSEPAEAQTCLDACKLLGFGDIFNLDSDGDGRACSAQ